MLINHIELYHSKIDLLFFSMEINLAGWSQPFSIPRIDQWGKLLCELRTETRFEKTGFCWEFPACTVAISLCREFSSTLTGIINGGWFGAEFCPWILNSRSYSLTDKFCYRRWFDNGLNLITGSLEEIPALACTPFMNLKNEHFLVATKMQAETG